MIFQFWMKDDNSPKIYTDHLFTVTK